MALNMVEKIDDRVAVRNVLASVSDKSGLERVIPALVNANPEIRVYSTGGTYKAIQEILGPRLAARNLIQVSDYTGQPEMQGGLVKTLDFKIYLGLLSETYNPAHALDLERVRAVAIDMVIVNLYPFEAAVDREDVTVEFARTNIDIGGPCMVRAAAKNFLRVASVTDPSDYAEVIEELDATDGATTLALRFELAKKAFAHTAGYDRAIAEFLGARSHEQVAACYECVG